jgi:hypothetical protein
MAEVKATDRDKARQGARVKVVDCFAVLLKAG